MSKQELEEDFERLIHSNIPINIQVNCYNPEIENSDCYFYLHKDCPNSCYMANRIKQGISHGGKTGLERFLRKYPFWKLGIGAMTIKPGGSAENSTNAKWKNKQRNKQ